MMAASEPATTPGGFGAVDADPAAAELVEALDEIASFPAVQRLRGTATALLKPRLGHRLVDVGCGTGEMARLLAGMVGPTGSMIGIESSETMLGEARRRNGNRALPIELRLGDAYELDLDDASVDGAYCERVFQHLGQPARAMAELVRITKPGGRIVVVDTDWGMHAIHGADVELTARVVTAFAEGASNGWSGRRLPALFADEGIGDPVIVAETVTSTDPRRPLLSPFTLMGAAAERSGAIQPGEAERWLAQLADAASHGHFFWAFTMFAVGGQRP